MRRLTLATTIVVLWTAPAFAWNALGHKVIAEIAWQQLDVPTRQSIVDTLKHHPRFAEDFLAKMPRDVATGDQAGTNADHHRSRGERQSGHIVPRALIASTPRW